MNISPSEQQLLNFAEWHNQPLTPGQERALNSWLAEDPINQDKWESWQRINGRAKRLQVVPLDANAQWVLLRDELGFRHTGTKTKRSRSGRKKEFHRQPSVVALISMIVYSLFLYVLFLIRSNVGF